MIIRYSSIILCPLLALLCSCSFAPAYQRPELPIPSKFKETGKWIETKPHKIKLTNIHWWEHYHDPILNELETQVTLNNQNLKASLARYQQAKALVQIAQAGYFPSIQAFANADRQKTSSTVVTPSIPALYNSVLFGAEVSYEPDIWGTVRNTVDSSKSLEKASLATLNALALSLHAELATDYFTLRGYDAAQRVLNRTVRAYQKALYLTQQRYQGGIVPIEEVDNAQLLLDNAKTAAIETTRQRAQLEHAIATLIGTTPAYFTLKAAPHLSMHFINIAPHLPSELLERRPDINAAELRTKAANANIGVARAAFFPLIDLTSLIGFQSKTLSNLLHKPSLFWSLGPASILTLTQPLASVTVFDGGRLLGLLKQANASYYETVAQYRQTVLTAFKEVEDALITIKLLDEENKTQTAATQAAYRSLTQAQYRVQGGVDTFLNVIGVEDQALQTELAQISIRTKRQVASVYLIKALGGGWAQN